MPTRADVSPPPARKALFAEAVEQSGEIRRVDAVVLEPRAREARKGSGPCERCGPPCPKERPDGAGWRRQ